MAFLKLTDIHKSYFLGKDEFPVLKGIDLSFEKGEFVSILGESGGGKSTLMKLIMRWYDWQAGQVYSSEVESRQVDKQHLQHYFAYVPQVPQIFKQTIRENFLLGRLDVSDEELLALAEKCYM